VLRLYNDLYPNYKYLARYNITSGLNLGIFPLTLKNKYLNP